MYPVRVNKTHSVDRSRTAPQSYLKIKTKKPRYLAEDPTVRVIFKTYHSSDGPQTVANARSSQGPSSALNCVRLFERKHTC